MFETLAWLVWIGMYSVVLFNWGKEKVQNGRNN